MLSAEYAELLANLPLFAGLDRVRLAKVAAYLEPIAVRAGDTLCRQGDPPDGLYVISSGRFGIFGTPQDGSREVQFSTCRRGEAVGEIALLTAEARTATVRAQEDGEVLRLAQTRFMELVRQDPTVGLAISAGLAR